MDGGWRGNRLIIPTSAMSVQIHYITWPMLLHMGKAVIKNHVNLKRLPLCIHSISVGQSLKWPCIPYFSFLKIVISNTVLWAAGKCTHANT